MVLSSLNPESPSIYNFSSINRDLYGRQTSGEQADGNRVIREMLYSGTCVKKEKVE